MGSQRVRDAWVWTHTRTHTWVNYTLSFYLFFQYQFDLLKINLVIILYIIMSVCWVTSVMSDSLLPMDCGLPKDSSGKNTGVGCRFLLQQIFPAQGSNPGEFLGQRNYNKIQLYVSNGKGDLFNQGYSRYMVQYKHLFLKASVVWVACLQSRQWYSFEIIDIPCFIALYFF